MFTFNRYPSMNSRLRRPVAALSSPRSVTQRAACSQISWPWWPTLRRNRIGILRNWLWWKIVFANSIAKCASSDMSPNVYNHMVNLYRTYLEFVSLQTPLSHHTRYQNQANVSQTFLFPTSLSVPWSTRQGALSMLAKTAAASWGLRAFCFQSALLWSLLELLSFSCEVFFVINLKSLNHQVREQRGVQELAAEKGAWCFNKVHGWDPCQCTWERARLWRGGEMEFWWYHFWVLLQVLVFLNMSIWISDSTGILEKTLAQAQDTVSPARLQVFWQDGELIFCSQYCTLLRCLPVDLGPKLWGCAPPCSGTPITGCDVGELSTTGKRRSGQAPILWKSWWAYS